MKAATNLDLDPSPKSFNAQEVGKLFNGTNHDVFDIYRPEDNIGITNGQNGMSDARYTPVRKDDAFAGVSCKCPPDTLMCELGDKAISRDLPLLIFDDNGFEYVAKSFAF
ncbi:hypothetical protein Cpir12675_000134 [Ceratocystis pirilliformis]|uniref:Uncharacterized protein n=1 Tax=Ceratocystis pirilliformis TaxID=259994 RepID=A0ABR3ZRB2_9PEZI